MFPTSRRGYKALLPALLCGGLLAAARPAEAKTKGTFYLVELQTGVGEGAYHATGPALTYGLSFGTTFKLKFLPMRWYVLGTVASRGDAVVGRYGGTPYRVDRRDLDAFLAQRLVLPVHPNVRVFIEGGIGQRYITQTVTRADIGTFQDGSHHLLVVLAAGVQARVSKTFSLGLRAQMTPLGGGAAVAEQLTDLRTTPNRLSLVGQVGVHF